MKKFDKFKSEETDPVFQYSPILLIRWLWGVKCLTEDIELKDYDKKWPVSYESENGRASTALPTSKWSLAISASKHNYEDDASAESLLDQELTKRP